MYIMGSLWNQLVKKVYHEGVAKHGKSYKFKQALKDASARKHEMGTMKHHGKTKRRHNKSRKHRRKRRS